MLGPWNEDYLKIDVQGFELAVLKGAQKALQDTMLFFPPFFLWCELDCFGCGYLWL